MKLVLTLLVRDEEDIVRENILYHLDQGVDFIIATDNLSTDGTTEILREFQRQGVVALIHETDDTYAQHRWVTRMARLARTRYGADWVINCDADEFWWPRGTTLPEALGTVPAEYALVAADRHNFCALRNTCTGGRFLWHEEMIYRTVDSVNLLGELLPPKLCHRGFNEVEIAQGNHSLVQPAGLPLFSGRPIEILHFPTRSASQLQNKIVKGGAAYGRNQELGHDVGHCWRTLYADWRRGELGDLLAEQILAPEQVANGLRDGSLVQDTRLRDFMRHRAAPTQ